MTVSIPDADSIASVFRQNVDEVAARLVAGYALKFKQEVRNLDSPLTRWLDFRFRYIDPMPRQLAWSNRFPVRRKTLPSDAKAALKKLTAMMMVGEDINRYQGRGLTLRNDFSGEKRDARTDLLWADWGIHHFHLSNEPLPTDQFFSRPADYLLFCVIGCNVVAIIDVLRHPDKEGFSNLELMRTVASSWPEYMKQFMLNGIIAAGQNRTLAEIHALRSGGVTPSLVIDGVSYMPPGGGITSASTPAKVTRAYDGVRALTRALAASVSDSGGVFRTPEISGLNVPPDFSLTMTVSGLAVYESHTQHAFLLPRAAQCAKAADWEILHDLILPAWACAAIAAGVQQNEQRKRELCRCAVTRTEVL